MTKKSKTNTPKASQFAPAGLWLAGLAVLVAIVTLIIKLLVSSGLYTPTNTTTFNNISKYTLLVSLVVVIIGPALYALLAPQRVREFLAGRQARHGSNAVIMVIAFLGILIGINIIVSQNPTPKWWTADWTESKQNTLAPETLDTLNALPTPVQAIGFFTARISKSSAQDLLGRYKNKSNGKFDYSFVDPETNPVLAQKYAITTDGSIVLVMGDRHELLTSVNEQDVTNALVRLMNPGNRTVYFLTGHGEHDTAGSGDTAYARSLAVLGTKNYTVKTLNLRAQNQVPEDALAIIIAGPTNPISADEMPLLEGYLAKGGALVLLEEPSILTNPGNSTDPLLAYLTSSWGITISNDLIIDANTNQYTVAIGATYGTHAITSKLQNLFSFFPSACSLDVSTVQGITTTPLVMTNQNSWGETNMTELNNNKVSFDSGADVPGPLTIAVAAENSSTKGRLVVFGDSDFASDLFFDQYANGDLLINSIDWAAGQENMINLTTPTVTQRTLRPVSSLAMLLIALSTVIMVPGLVIGGGIAAWLVRRSRG